MDKEYDFKEEADAAAAQCWCFDETSDIEMDVRLANVISRVIQGWMCDAATYCRNADYYRDLLVECGEIIGEEAYISDDGSHQQDVLCAKIPELVKGLTQP